MGTCSTKPLYKFDNFVTIERQLPKPTKNINVSNFEFQIHPYSPQYIRQNIYNQYNQDTDGAEESFIVTEYTGMKVFELRDELVTKKDKISDCLKSVIIGKICSKSAITQTHFLRFVQPQTRNEHKKDIFNIIIQTLIDIDLTCFAKDRYFGVYFDWPLFAEGKTESYIVDMISDIHKRNNLMDNSMMKKN